MARSRHPSEREIDAILAGRMSPGDESLDVLPEFVDEIKARYVHSPTDATRARHMAMIAQAAAHLSTNTSKPGRVLRRPPNRRQSMFRNRPAALTARIAATAGSVLALTAGLAVAGVDLPTQADDAFESVGISLPNQAGGNDNAGDATQPSETSTAVHKVIDATTDRNCKFGQAVATAASGRDSNPNACGATKHGKSAAHRPANSGKDASTRARQQRAATFEQRQQLGQQTAAGAQDLGDSAQQAGQAHAQRGSEAGPGASVGNRP